MKSRFSYKLLMVFILIATHALTCEAVSLPDEKVVLFTDRSVYITGEQVSFYASVFNKADLNKPVQSQVLYCEIITPDGNRVTGSKFLMSQSSVAGCVSIPGNLLTGIYYFRAYTKMMRNSGPEFYCYTQLKIINPGRPEILSTENGQNNLPSKFALKQKENLKEMITVSVDKSTYHSRDTITLSLQPTRTGIAGIKSFCLSVIPEGTSLNSVLTQDSKGQPVDKQDYYTETRGLSLSGKLTEAASSTPVTNRKVNLSIIGTGRDFMATRTDSIGRFFFALPDYVGARDLFVCAEKTELPNVKIWIDNDFCTRPIHLPSPVFRLTETELQKVRDMASNVQISSQFYNDTIRELQTVKNEEFAFYGKPSAIIYLDNYIQLPTLEDYFNELPSQVRVRKTKGVPHFNVLGSRGLSFYDPLVMIDWVAVDEPSKILAISPSNISRIEVVNEDYVKGGQTYGGIISIISKKGDFAGIDLPSTGLFINYHFLDENNCNNKAFDNVSMHPDSRNTLLWKPGIVIRDGQSEKFTFTAPDTPGRYNFIVSGISSTGDIISSSGIFEVSK